MASKRRPPKQARVSGRFARARAREPAKPKRSPGRPTDYTEEKGVLICAWLALGKTLSDYCRTPGAPAWATVHEWLDRHREFRQRYDSARVLFAHMQMEEALRIADTPMLGETETVEDVELEVGGEGEKLPAKKRKVTREDMIAHRRLQVETRFKFLARCFPQIYGAQMKLEHKGKLTLEDLVEGSMDSEGQDDGGAEQ